MLEWFAELWISSLRCFSLILLARCPKMKSRDSRRLDLPEPFGPMTATNFWLDRAYVVERSDHLLALVGLEVFERDAVHDQSPGHLVDLREVSGG